MSSNYLDFPSCLLMVNGPLLEGLSDFLCEWKQLIAHGWILSQNHSFEADVVQGRSTRVDSIFKPTVWLPLRSCSQHAAFNVILSFLFLVEAGSILVQVLLPILPFWTLETLYSFLQMKTHTVLPKSTPIPLTGENQLCYSLPIWKKLHSGLTNWTCT